MSSGSMNPTDPDEVRRRRLARLATTAAAADSPAVESTTPKGEKRRLEVVAAPPVVEKMQESPVSSTAPSPRKESTPEAVHQMFKRCLKVTVGDSTASLAGVPASAVPGGKLSSSNVEGVIKARLLVESTEALLWLSGIFERLHKECRNARSRGDAFAARELQAGCEAASRLAAACLEAPGSLGPSSEGADVWLAEALASPPGSKVKQALRPDLVKQALRALSDDRLESVGRAVVDHVTQVLRGENLGAETAAAASQALADFVSYAGKARGGKAVASHAELRAPPLKASNDAPTPAVPMYGRFSGLFAGMIQEAQARGGYTFEQDTALGLAMRAGAVSRDSAARQDLTALLQRPTRGVLEGKTRELSNRVSVVRTSLEALCGTLVKNSETSRESTVRWFAALWARSADAQATMRDAAKVPSVTARLNACATLLRLCRPVVGDKNREANARTDLAFLTKSDMGRAIFPSDLTRVAIRDDDDNNDAPAPAPAASAAADEDSDAEMYDDGDDEMDEELQAALAMSREPVAMDEDFHFVTTLFFLTVRGLRLGLVTELERHAEEQDRLGHAIRQVGMENNHIQQLAAAGVALEAELLQDELLDDGLSFSCWVCRWLLSLSDEDLKKTPEHVVEDVAALPALVARFKPAILKRAPPLADLLKLVARCLSRKDELVRSPHLRDKLAQAMYDCYLPYAAQSETFGGPPRGGIFRNLVTSAPVEAESATDAQANIALLLDGKSDEHKALAPAILWLFGDAEHLGFYEVPVARLRVAALIRQLWTAPFHRAAFRAIAEDKSAFVTFANGLLNETNRLVASAMEKLPLIRDHQVRTGVLAVPPSNHELAQLREDYLAAPQARRDELDERFTDAERHLAPDLKLCTETLSLVELLTSDPAVSTAFGHPDLRVRLGGMLLSVMRAFTGRRSLDIKIENPEKYGFDPRDILTRVGRVATHFAKMDDFAAALAASGYFEDTLLTKTTQTLRRIKTLDDASLQALDALARDAKLAHDAVKSYDAFESNAPDNYLDAITCSLMTDPVKLPSGHVCDASSIKQHLLNEKTDPFSRLPMQEDDLVPLAELQAEIKAWILQQQQQQP